VLAGGEVVRDGLEGRILQAHALFFLREDSCLLGIAALKNPSTAYRASVFRKACATVSSSKFPLELGWVFIMPSARGRKLCHRLIRATIAHVASTQIFATSRTDNPAMHVSLIAASFARHGAEYASSRGTYKLGLFLCTPSAK
jgi:predicted GNAT family N-acyltransferase